VGAGAVSPAGAANSDEFGGLPKGPGREEVCILCDSCHSILLVLQQRLDRETWEEVLVWMVEEQVMPEPEPDERARILDYLSIYFSPDVPR
jgi:hypothetical protein